MDRNYHISVCMATYNGARFIKKQIDSILSQLSENDELIISDDHSTDHTIEIINSIPDNRIKLFIHKQKASSPIRKSNICKNNFMATSNFENALNYATGEFVF